MSIIIYYDHKEYKNLNIAPVKLINSMDISEVQFRPKSEYKTSTDNNFLFIECFGKHVEHFDYYKFSKTMEKEPGQPSQIDDPRFLKNYLKMHSWSFQITPEMKSDIDNGKLKILLNATAEGFWDINTDYVSALLDVPKESIILLSGDFQTNGKQDIDSYYINYWERSLIGTINDYKTLNNVEYYGPFREQIDNIKNKIRRKYNATFYNRTVRYHRVIAMAAFYQRNALDNLLWSWGGDQTGILDGLRNNERHRYLMIDSKLGKDYKQSVDEILDWGDMQVGRPSKEDMTVNLAYVINDNHIKETYYQIINETWVTDNLATNFLSEKSFKPFMLGQPFIQNGDAKNIKYLKLHNYHTFDNIFDQSYNHISDSTERLHKLIDVVLDTNDMWQTDGPDILFNNLDRIQHNYENLLKAPERYGLPLDQIVYR